MKPNKNVQDEPVTLEAPTRTDAAGKRMTERQAKKATPKDTPKEKKAAPTKKPPVWSVHYGHIVVTNGQNTYKIEHFEHPSLSAALNDLNGLAKKHENNGIRELILAFPKVK